MTLRLSCLVTLKQKNAPPDAMLKMLLKDHKTP